MTPDLANWDGYRLVDRLACLDLPSDGPPVTNADELLDAIVAGSDSRGRSFANPKLLRRLFWWQETDAKKVERWRDELVERGEVEIQPLGRSCYGGNPVDVLTIVNRRRFERFAERDPIPQSVRQEVYERDGWQCLHCGAQETLSLDHIVPWSKGGPDTPDNLQTLCGPCNSSKGARY